MTPFKERSKYSVDTKLTLSSPVSGTIINKDYVAGVDIHLVTDLLKRKSFVYISCVDWQAQDNLNAFSHENSPINLGQSQDLLNYSPWSEQTERLSADVILKYNLIEEIDINEIKNMKDGRITALIQSPLSYFMRDEFPFSAKGIKCSEQTINGEAKAIKATVPYYDFDPDFSFLTTTYVSNNKYIATPFQDEELTSIIGSLSIKIDDDHFSRYDIRASGGFTYSKSQTNIDSIAFGGLYR